MIIKLLSSLSLIYGFAAHSKADNESNYGFESLKELGDFIDKSWSYHITKGEKNPKYLTEKVRGCLLLVNIESNNSIKMVFVDKKTRQKVYDNRRNIDIENPPKDFLCHGVIS